MPILHAIILGIVQGLSEFLPISSSGHLLAVPWLFGWDELERDPDLKRTFDVALHIGTFIGVVIYFRADVRGYAAAAWRSLRRRSVEGDEERLAWMLAVSALPAATVGFALDSLLEGRYGPEWLIAVMLVVFGVVLLWADRLPGARPEGAFGLRDALLMGAAQALALQPGVSRSGATMSMGRWLGFTRPAAARLSFLMSIPIIGGAGLYKALQAVSGPGIPADMRAAIAWGTLASAVTGFLAIAALLRLIRTTTFTPFVIYRFAAAAVILTAAATIR